MPQKKRPWIGRLAVVSLFLVVVSLVGCAQSGVKDREHHQWSPKERTEMLKKIGMSDEQLNEVDAIRKQAEGEASVIRQKLDAEREGLHSYMMSSKATETEALARQADISRLQAELKQVRIKTWFKMRGVMTPQQLEQFIAQRKQMKGSQGKYRCHSKSP